MRHARSLAAKLAYDFSEDDVPRATAVLDPIFDELIDGWTGWGAVEKAAEEQPTPLTPSCVRALIHVVVRPLDLDLHGSRGSELDVSARGGIPAVRDLPSDEVALWSAVVEQVAAPAARARLADLLFLRREGRVGVHARRAITAYLDAIENRPDDMDTTTYILRAWTLVRQIRAQDLKPQVLERITDRVDALVEGDGRAMPGSCFPCSPP